MPKEADPQNRHCEVPMPAVHTTTITPSTRKPGNKRDKSFICLILGRHFYSGHPLNRSNNCTAITCNGYTLSLPLLNTLAEHPAGNYRVLSNLANELLALGARKQVSQLDEDCISKASTPNMPPQLPGENPSHGKQHLHNAFRPNASRLCGDATGPGITGKKGTTTRRPGRATKPSPILFLMPECRFFPMPINILFYPAFIALIRPSFIEKARSTRLGGFAAQTERL